MKCETRTCLVLWGTSRPPEPPVGGRTYFVRYTRQSMQQLLCRDLKPGDVLLKMATPSVTHKLIKLGQRLAGQPNAFLAHAAIALDTQFAIEAQKAGVTANHLAMKNKDAGYIVYRPHKPALGTGAATAAKLLLDINQRTGQLKYDAIGAAKSLIAGSASAKTAADMDALLDNMLGGHAHPFFCSQFVVFVYQFAGLQSGMGATAVFSLPDPKVSPSALASMLVANPQFSEAGYMLPNER